MASPRATVKVEGLSALNRALRRLDKATAGEAVDIALLAAAEPVREEAGRLASRSATPGGTTGKGHAADHIGKVLKSRSARNREVFIGPEAEFWYLVFDEFGTPHQSANAPLRTAADTRFKAATLEFKKTLAREIRRWFV